MKSSKYITNCSIDHMYLKYFSNMLLLMHDGTKSTKVVTKWTNWRCLEVAAVKCKGWSEWKSYREFWV